MTRVHASLALAIFVASSALAAPAQIVGDAMPASLTGVSGDPATGRAIIVDRTRGLCLLCHAGPFPEVRFQGNLSPDLGGAGVRWSAGQLRLRIVDSRRLDPDTIMPPFYAIEGLATEGSARVGKTFAGRTILSAQEVEDVVAFLTTLRD